MVVAFASRLITAVLTHRADHADAPISSPLALSSCRSVVAMVVAISSLLVTAVLTRIADRAEAPISLPPALSSIVSRVAMVSACSPYRIAAVLKYRADRAEMPGLMLDDCGAGVAITAVPTSPIAPAHPPCRRPPSPASSRRWP